MTTTHDILYGPLRDDMAELSRLTVALALGSGNAFDARLDDVGIEQHARSALQDVIDLNRVTERILERFAIHAGSVPQDSNLVVCRHCREAGDTSTVSADEGTRATAMIVNVFHDEQGRRHRHDPNTYTTSYRCSQGHVWEERQERPCPVVDCGWNRGEMG